MSQTYRLHILLVLYKFIDALKFDGFFLLDHASRTLVSEKFNLN